MRSYFRVGAALLSAAVMSAPVTAGAQSAPSQLPSYAVPDHSDRETLHGTVLSFDGSRLQLNDDRGFVDNVAFDASTAVVPAGTRLQFGMRLTVIGSSRGTAFAAARVEAQALSPTSPGAPMPGTLFTGIIGTKLDSASAYVGESVVLGNVSSTDGYVSGATLSGTVSDVTKAGQARPAQLKLHFDTLRLADGTIYHIDTVVNSMQVNTKNNAAKEVGGALVGMLLGNAFGKVFFGAAGGGAIGAVGGYLIAKDNRTDVTVPADTAITVLVVTPRSQAGS